MDRRRAEIEVEQSLDTEILLILLFHLTPNRCVNGQSYTGCRQTLLPDDIIKRFEHDAHFFNVLELYGNHFSGFPLLVTVGGASCSPCQTCRAGLAASIAENCCSLDDRLPLRSMVT